MFKAVNPQANFAELEEETLAFWQKEAIFQKSLEQNKNGVPYIFYDGPPTANARPALHHALPSSFKDAACRYQSMQGKRVTLQPGWDTHGLPVEVQVEKALGLNGKKEILNLVPGDEAASIAKFNEICRTSVWEFKQDWDKFIVRVGRWMDMEHPYSTYDTSYIEGVWSALKQIWDKELVFKDYKVLPYCPRCGTGLSAAEVALEYQDVKDVSVYVSFPLLDNPKRSFIAWTTTPWTLPGHVALALGPDIVYVVVQQDDHEYILAKERLAVLKGEYVIIEEHLGKDLLGLEYEPLFPGIMNDKPGKHFITVSADFVTTTDGSGIVHTACMYGEDDFNLGQKEGLTMFHTVNLQGNFTDDVPEFAGMYIRDALVPILKSLTEKRKLYAKQTITHSYPHCWRCKTPLVYYAKDSWYIGMSKLRKELQKSNETVEWIPDNVKEGRFGDFIKEARDWAISRERFWGTPMPIWTSKSGKRICVGSLAEVKELAKNPELVTEDFDPHRPYIDQIVLVKDGEEYVREPYVLDVWFDSGSMPFASGLAGNGDYPADFIAEAVDQTRGWFYSLMAVGTIIKGASPYKRVMCMGHLVDEHGKKMSKSIGNIIVPADAFAVCGADAVRWFIFTVNSPGETKAFGFKELQTSFRKALLPLWNMFNYFLTYANLSDFEAPQDAYKALDALKSSKSLSDLDLWALSRQQAVLEDMTVHYEASDFMRAGRAFEDHITDLSTWYLRRSRKREDTAFFTVLYTLLMENAKVMAPMAPFMSENMYQILRNPNDAHSIHLTKFSATTGWRNLPLEAGMTQVRQVVELGLAVRAQEKMKVRQPLPKVAIQGGLQTVSRDLLDSLAEELNVEEVLVVETVDAVYVTKTDFGLTVGLDINLTEELQQRGEARELLRQLQNLRKQSGLQPGQEVTLISGPSFKAWFEQCINAYPSLLSDGFFKITDETWTELGKEEITVNNQVIPVSFQ